MTDSDMDDSYVSLRKVSQLESTMTNFRFRAHIKVKHSFQANDWGRTAYFVIDLEEFTISSETYQITTPQFTELKFINESYPRKLSRMLTGTYRVVNQNINYQSRSTMHELTGRKMPYRVDVIFFGNTPKLELAIIDVDEYNNLKFLYENRQKVQKKKKKVDQKKTQKECVKYIQDLMEENT